MQVVRKERAVGVVPKGTVVYEQLEELAISAASNLIDMPVPFCAFNGGSDVFVDIGNKSLGLHALMKFLGAKSEQVHFAHPQHVQGSVRCRSVNPHCVQLTVLLVA
jgi:IMP and pyridine-specific 5'-nucleotidase